MATAQPHRRLLAVVMCLIAFAACDDNDFASSNPTGPSFTGRLSGPPITGSLSSGAVISGRVSGITSNLTTDQTSGLTAPRVGIAPPGISTVVGRDGDFTLTGVPAGNVTLIFSSNGVSAGIILTNVRLDDLIVLDVRVNSGVATIESEHRRRRDRTSG